ncbi:MAG: peptidylprolyl isomerase [Polyangia bacterium]|nr:peptidylprolyl isomerase [Polyangia bacterium]
MAAAGPGPVSTTGQNPKVAIRTSAGDFLLELDPKSAPVTVKNFLRYVDEKFYDGTIFHRVMVDFMIQGGGFGEDLQQKQTHEPIKNEADNGLKNLRGTVAMARTQVVDSATAQFFINVKDNPALDHRGPGPGFGYAVFGKVVEGMEVVDKIRQVNVQARGMMFQHLPATPVIIRTVRRVP